VSKDRPLGLIIRLIVGVLLLELVILGFITLLSRYLGWNTIEEIASAIEFAGFIAIGIGLLSLAGFWESTRSFSYQYSLTVGQKDGWERVQQTLVDFAQTYGFLLLMLSVGLLNLLIGWMVRLYF
jgi:hypothetical protein